MEKNKKVTIFLTDKDLIGVNDKTVLDYELTDFKISVEDIRKADDVFYVDYDNQIIKILKSKHTIKENLYFNF